MKIFVGLGNPGKKYQNTRHNVGFMVVDKIAENLGLKFQDSAKTFCQIAKNKGYILIKPQTYMNESGRAVRAVLDYYNVDLLDLLKPFDEGKQKTSQLFVIHDDLDLEFSIHKMQFAKGPKVHNGLNSIYQHLGSENFWHIRMGVDNRERARLIPGKDYVLTNFSQEEQLGLQSIIAQLVTKLLL
jgi:peptidyl-tRNA hydrolase, PTH1 family